MYKSTYQINKSSINPNLDGNWNSPVWKNVLPLEIAYFRPESSNHRPETFVKLLYNDESVFGIIKVNDNYIQCIHSKYQDMVCEDSCVEWFVQPQQDKGYFNFEFNCGGTLHCSYIEDHTRTSNGFKKFDFLTKEHGEKIKVFHSLPKIIEQEITTPTIWYIEFQIPISILRSYIEDLKPIRSGSQWKGNFFKCGDRTSFPHWASWAPVSELNFHQPLDFGRLIFE